MIPLERTIHGIFSSTIKRDVLKVNAALFFGKMKGRKIGTMIGNKAIMGQCRFTTLEDSDACPVSVTLQNNFNEKTAVSHTLGVVSSQQIKLTTLKCNFTVL